MPEVNRQRVRIVFDDLGAGRAVVLAHSFLASGAMWEPVLPTLAEHGRVVNVDLRGHGRSGAATEPFTLYDMVADVVAVLEALGIERAVWAGLSIGGMIALRAALTAPESVSGLILLDTDAGAEKPGVALRYRLMALGARAVGLRPFLPFIMPLMFGSTTRRTRPDLVAAWRRRIAAAHVPSMLRTLGALIRRDDLGARLGAITVPTLVLVGTEDAALPPSRSKRIAAAIPGASIEEVPRAGHLAALEQPATVSAAMRRFLAEPG